VEKEPVTSEEQNDDETSEEGRGIFNEWFAENMRMAVSVLIVVAIAGGIYAYSKRAQAPNANKSISSTEENSEGKISVIGGDENETSSNQETNTGTSEEQTAPKESNQTAAQPQTSQETQSSFVETAAKGDGATILARRALANYLEKNPDTALTVEHKIYIEDYLRRQVKDGRIKVGDNREFSKDSIAKAIEKSKGLSDKQLKNLHKYAQKAPSLK
jgi:hypothetical protein